MIRKWFDLIKNKTRKFRSKITWACPDCWTSFPSIVISHRTVNWFIIVTTLNSMRVWSLGMSHLVIRGDLIILLVKSEQAEWRHILWHYFNSLTPTQRSSIVLPYFFRIDNNSYLCGMNLAARSPNIGLPIWVSDSWNIEIASLDLSCPP